jgi:uncharacterized protein
LATCLQLILLGVTAGILNGIIGIGGGIIIVPALVFLFKLPQLTAQGTTIALMVPPIGILAAWTYYRHGYVDVRVALFVCLGFIVGGLIGASIATRLSNAVMEKLFGMVLLIIALKMLLS